MLRETLPEIRKDIQRGYAEAQRAASLPESSTYKLGEQISKSEARVVAVVARRTATEIERLAQYDLATGEILRERWIQGWASEFPDPPTMANIALDFFALNRDTVQERDEYIAALEARVRWLEGFVDPARRLREMEEKLMAMAFARGLQGVPMSPDELRGLFSVLRESARSPLVREELPQAMTVDLKR